MEIVGIAPTSKDFQSFANLSQLYLLKILSARLELTYPGYKSGASPTKLREWKIRYVRGKRFPIPI